FWRALSMTLPPPSSSLFPSRRSSDLSALFERLLAAGPAVEAFAGALAGRARRALSLLSARPAGPGLVPGGIVFFVGHGHLCLSRDRKSTRLNSSHVKISYAVFCL